MHKTEHRRIGGTIEQVLQGHACRKGGCLSVHRSPGSAAGGAASAERSAWAGSAGAVCCACAFDSEATQAADTAATIARRLGTTEIAGAGRAARRAPLWTGTFEDARKGAPVLILVMFVASKATVSDFMRMLRRNT